MQKIILTLVLIVWTSSAHAFLYDFKVKSMDEIKKLTNEEIIDAYTNAVIERRTSEAFYSKAGFAPKEYESFKTLLHYLVDLHQEMAARELTPPPIEDWIR
jgi:hypothetical protein